MNRYEDLRQQALAQPRGSCWGLTLFLNRGLVAWMQAWPETWCTAKAIPHRNLDQQVAGISTAGEMMATGLRKQVVAILVNMVLNSNQEVYA